ncbi:Pfs, NACHT and Ankyrin domain protein, partial [Metarhizium majus ARSEF 297]
MWFSQIKGAACRRIPNVRERNWRDPTICLITSLPSAWVTQNVGGLPLRTLASHNSLDSPDSYAVAWVAALPIERAAAEAMLDEEHAAPTGFTRHQTDPNVYTWGRVGEHNIVIASLAAGVYGTTSAATTASSLLASLPSIRVGLLVGIGGGIARPDEDRDIRLGDIVVSEPDGITGGVCQYDLLKAKSGDKRQRKGFLGRPPTVLLNALASIQADHERKDPKVPFNLQEMLDKNPKMGKRSKQNPGYAHQGIHNDRLFKASCEHVPGPDCRGCDTADEVQRDPRDTTEPEIHYGTIVSGNILVKDAAARDRIVADVGEDCICFEMEAAGLMNHFPCLVIRGICDYADSHKNDRCRCVCQGAPDVRAGRGGPGDQEGTGSTSVGSDLRTDKVKRWLCPPDPSTNGNQARKLRHEGTGAWLLDNLVFQEWHSGSRRHLWLNGLAGCGKTVLSATVLDHLTEGNDRLILSFFFDFSDTTKQTLDGMLRSLAFEVYQGGAGFADVLDATFEAHQDGRDQPATSTLEDVVCKMLAVQKKGSIVLDALDESTTRDELLLWMKDVVSRPELGDVQLMYRSA